MADFFYNSSIQIIFFINLIAFLLFIIAPIASLVGGEKRVKLLFQIEAILLLTVLFVPILSSIFKDYGYFKDVYTKYDNFYQLLMNHPKNVIIGFILFFGGIFMFVGYFFEFIKDFNDDFGFSKLFSIMISILAFCLFGWAIYTGFQIMDGKIMDL